MAKPCPIPRDLKTGDRLWYSKTEYAIVTSSGYGAWIDRRPSIHCELPQHGRCMRYYLTSGKEVCNDTSPIISIERIASASAKPKKAKPSAVDRLIEAARRCVPFVNPKAFAGELAKTRPMKECYLNDMLRRAVNAARRERAVARRLGGGK